MAIISCPECGKQISDRATSCPNCGCPIGTTPATQTQPHEDLTQFFTLARRARAGNDAINAKKYYDQILMKAPGNWEAMFYSIYFEASACKIMQIASAANSVANCIYGTFAAISDLNDEEDESAALRDVIASATAIAQMLINGAIGHYNQFSSVNGSRVECSGRVVAAGGIYFEIERCLKLLHPTKTELLCDFQKQFMKFLEANSTWLSTTACTRLLTEITIADPAYGERVQKEKRLKAIEQELNAIEHPAKTPLGCVGSFFMIAASLMIILGAAAHAWWAYLVAIPEIIIGSIFIRKGKTGGKKETPAETEKRKQDLIKEREELKRELNS